MSIINPDGEGFLIEDVDGYLAGLEPGDEPMVDLGGGMVVPLRELLEDNATIQVRQVDRD